jgi:uncharacterized cupredoxin-like copper-binding protein
MMDTVAAGHRLVAFGLAALALPAAALADRGHSHAAPIGQPAKASASARTVRLDMGEMFFAPRTLEVKAGEVVRFVLTNSGELLHEFSIGTPAMQAEHRKEMAAMAEKGMLTPTGIDEAALRAGGSHRHDHPNSALVEPGRTREIVWKFAKAAELEFACNLPGHYESGMVGAFRFVR